MTCAPGCACGRHPHAVDYAAVAQAYTTAKAAGYDPIRAVAERSGLTWRGAQSRIHRARQAGLIPGSAR